MDEAGIQEGAIVAVCSHVGLELLHESWGVGLHILPLVRGALGDVASAGGRERGREGG